MGEANAVVDANYALTDIVSPALNLHFARDAMGDIIALGNAAGANPASETYTYDPLYRLTGLTDANGNPEEAYTYSKTGDRLSKTATGLDTGIYSYQSGTHHLSSIGNASRVYDANGNTTGSVVGGNTYGFGYNGRNRMTVAQLNGSTVGTYTYNAVGQRTAKAATFPAALNQRFVYDESSQLLGEYGSNTRDYIWLDGMPVATVDTTGTTSTVSYVTADGLNTPRAVSDSNGNMIWQLAYQGNPFGEQQPTSANGYALNMRFPGQYFDVESGLAYNVNRDFEPASGRYLQPDPLGLLAGPNVYAYGLNNPLSNADPLGLWVPPAIPAPVTNFLVGAADDLSFGIGPLLRDEYDIDGGIDPCSTAYKAGGYAALAAGVARLGYAGAAKAIAANPALDGMAASAARNSLKAIFRGGFFTSYRAYDYEQLLARYGSDEAIKAAAGRTSAMFNSIGADAAAGSLFNHSECGCPK